MFEYENLTVSKLSLVLKTGCYSQRESMFTFQKYFFFGTKTYFVYVCVTERKKTVTRRAPIFRLADADAAILCFRFADADVAILCFRFADADAAILCFRLLLRRHLTSASLPLRPVVRSHIFG